MSELREIYDPRTALVLTLERKDSGAIYLVRRMRRPGKIGMPLDEDLLKKQLTPEEQQVFDFAALTGDYEKFWNLTNHFSTENRYVPYAAPSCPPVEISHAKGKRR